jgi:glycosyltransferase involved in cell wall biosynthesis
MTPQQHRSTAAAPADPSECRPNDERAWPAISIVTPCLNAAASIGRALESVRDQNYPNVEHIVVDGGSSDGTVELLQAQPHLRFISEPDAGLSDAMNKGIRLAAGELVGWLNADDWYLPGALHAVAAAHRERSSAPWITGRCPIVDADGREIRRAVTEYKNFFLRHYSFPLYLTQNFVSCPATFVRRSVYEEVGPFRLDYHYSMDYDMFLRVAKVGDPIVLDKNLAVFTMVEGTKSMSGFEHQFEEHHRLAREHGAGHPFAVGVNRVASRAIILTYRALRKLRDGSFPGGRRRQQAVGR